MEGATVESIKLSILDYRVSNYRAIHYPSNLFLIGEYDLQLMDRLYESQTSFGARLNLGILDVSECKKYCDKIYEKNHIERMQGYYLLAKAKELDPITINSLKVVNPYTAGLKLLMLAWHTADFFEADALYKEAINSLFHIKYYYTEAILYYTQFLKDNNDERYEIELAKGKALSVSHCYRFLLHSYVQLESSTNFPYIPESYPLPEDLLLSEYKDLIYVASRK